MLLICYGTRPEYLKVKPLIEQMQRVGINFKTLFTGQHLNLVNAKTDYRLEIKDGRCRLDSIVASILDAFDFTAEGIDTVLVQGDTTSSYAIALSAFHHQVRVVHLEAGLRTYNLAQPYPEEANRQMIARLASVHLCPTELAKSRLIDEKVTGLIEVVGNTVLDNLIGVETSLQKKVLVTMHRRENHGALKEWFTQLDKLAHEHSAYEFVLPIHPNPVVMQHQDIFKKVKVVPPMGYNDLIKFLSECSFVITDSGGIQEEAAFFRKPCLVCRKETERTEGLNNFSLLCESPDLLFQRRENLRALEMKGPCPYGDGNSSGRIIRILEGCGLL
jgi:UDP-N-acetylglucosamine 2-epimerase (non-hydrolysing)